MLNTVPKAVNDMARSVIENHPNTYNIELYKKNLDRENHKTLGGLGVLSGEDEDNVSWEWACNGYALQTGNFQASQITDRHDAPMGSEIEILFLIALEEKELQIEKGYVIYILFGDVVKLAYEIVGVETVIGIPPFSMRYVTNRRSELDIFI